MAKNDIKIKINVDGKDIELTKKQAEKLGKELDNTGKSTNKLGKETDKTTYATKKGINATANGTKNFSNMARGISGGLVPAYATLAANVFALTAVFGFLKSAADYRVLKEGQAAYAGVTGIAYKSLTNSIIDATDAQITYNDAAQAAAIGTSAGLSSEQLEKLGAAAKTVSIALGRDVTDSFNRLIRGTTKAEPELLDELGIILRLDTATRAYADALGVSKESLNAFQRTQAVTADVLGQVESKFNAINAIMEPQTNKINKLAKSFDDLMNSVKTFVVGPAEALATFFAENLGAALGALGLFVLPIIQSILPAFDDLAIKAETSMARHNTALDLARTQLNQYRDTSKMAQAQAERTFNTLQTKAQGLAQTSGMPKARAGSGMRALQEGRTISPRQAAAIKKQVSNTESIYFISNKKIRRSWIKTMDDMVMADKVKNGKIKVQVKSLELTYKKSFAAIRVGWQAAMTGMTKAASKAGRLISRAFGIFTFISIGLLAFEGLKVGAQKMGLFGGAADDAGNKIGKLAEKQRELNVELGDMFAAREKLKEIEAPFETMVKNAGNLFMSANFGGDIQNLQKIKEEMNQLQENAGGSMANARHDGRVVTGTERVRNKITGGSSTINTYRAATEDEKRYRFLQVEETKYRKAVGETIKLFGGEFKNVLKSVNEQGLFTGEIDKNGKLKLADGVGDFITVVTGGSQAIENIKNSTGKFGQQITANFGKASNKVMLLRTALQFTKDEKAILASMQAQNAQAPGTFSEEDIVKQKGKLKTRSDFSSGINTSVTAERTLITTKATLALNKESLKQRIYAGTILGQQMQVKLQMLEKEAAITQLTAEIEYRRANVKKGDEETNLQEIENMQNSISLLTKQKLGLKDSIDLTKQLGIEATNAFANSMQKGIQGVIDGTMSMKDAFKGMAQSILQSLAQVLAKMLAMKILTSAFGIPMAEGGIIPMAKGGIITGYASGGIATEPTYLVGEGKHNEAVVPLPDGRRIPVDMNGGGGTNNVTINVDANGGTSSTGDGEQGKALGMAIQAAVMETLQREKRPGGVLGGG